ncbi:MAG: hypothetical protein IJY43_05095 [Clostridia bacterium]|nr:hypothetical protein [Clostridia bacterium]
MAKELYFCHQEFERTVREALSIYDRPLTDADVAAITELDCSNFSFSSEDLDVLSCFQALRDLTINTNADDLSFLQKMSELEHLDMECWSQKNAFDLRALSHLHKLKYLFISGGDISDMDLLHSEALVGLRELEDLCFHEFGTVDLQPLRHMPWIRTFFCGWANSVKHVEAIGTLQKLKELTLISFAMKDLDFLDALPSDLELELCSLGVEKGIPYEKLKRFYKGNFDEIDKYP